MPVAVEDTLTVISFSMFHGKNHGKKGGLMKTREELEEFAKQIRIDVVNMSMNSKKTGAHIGGAFSAAEILAVLYGSVSNVYPNDPENEYRDRIILSKSHAAVALYSALCQVGFIPRDDIDNAMMGESELYKHPKKSIERGIECSGGSLGMGLSFAVGIAQGLKLKNNSEARVFVILGDGECNEGSVWEAAASIIHYQLNNITTIVDVNKYQIDGSTEEVVNAGDTAGRWASLGFDVVEVDGHDVMRLQEEFSKKRGAPTVILCDTVKGKGVSFTENRVEWHIGRLSEEQAEQALEELKSVITE